jgi:hypothetical protein
MEQGSPSCAKKAYVEEESEEETQEPKTLWDARLDIRDFIKDSFSYAREVERADELEDDARIKATERHCLQLAFLTHQCQCRMAARNRDAAKLLREKEAA